MPKVNLSQQRTQPVGLSKLSPVQFNNSAAAGALRAPQIDTSAARISYTKMTPNIIQDDMVTASLRGGANMMNVYNDAAFEYNERNERAQSDEAVNAFNRKLTNSFSGTTDENGNIIPGYEGSERKGAVESYPGYTGAVKQWLQEDLEALPEGVRKKAALRMSDVANRTLLKAANHRARQNESYQQEVKYENFRNMGFTLIKDGVVAYSDGRVDDCLNNNTETLEQRDKMAFDLAETFIQRIYNEAIKSDGITPSQAAAVARAAYSAAEGTLSAEGNKRLDFFVSQLERAGAKDDKARYTERMGMAAREASLKAPGMVQQAIAKGEPENIGIVLDDLRMLAGEAGYSIEKTEDMVIAAYTKGALEGASKVGGGITNQIRVASERHGQFKEMGLMTESEKYKLHNYMLNDFVGDLKGIRNNIDEGYTILLLEENEKRIAAGEAPLGAKNLEDMLPENRELLIKATENMLLEAEEGVSADNITYREANSNVLKAKQLDRVLSGDEMKGLLAKTATGELSTEEYLKAYKNNEKIKKTGKTRTTGLEGWSASKGFISDMRKIGAFSGWEVNEKPDSGMNQEEMLSVASARAEEEKKFSESVNALESAMRGAENGEQFNTQEWWENYKSSAGLGNPPPGNWSKFGSFLTSSLGNSPMVRLPKYGYKKLVRDDEVIDLVYNGGLDGAK